MPPLKQSRKQQFKRRRSEIRKRVRSLVRSDPRLAKEHASKFWARVFLKLERAFFPLLVLFVGLVVLAAAALFAFLIISPRQIGILFSVGKPFQPVLPLIVAAWCLTSLGILLVTSLRIRSHPISVTLAVQSVTLPIADKQMIRIFRDHGAFIMLPLSTISIVCFGLVGWLEGWGLWEFSRVFAMLFSPSFQAGCWQTSTRDFS